ncbi:MAG: antitoxin [Oscillospiraceae bacterium]|nr:antitoxin [Oscillospiraceae bacterium]
MGKTSAAATNKYAKKAYDRIIVLVPKGQKPILQEYAKSRAESLNAFVKRAINNQLENDKKTKV